MTPPEAAVRSPRVDPLLDWAAEALAKAEGRLPSSVLAAQVSSRLLAFVGRLDVLLAMDARFRRSDEGGWELGPPESVEVDAGALVQQALALREQAVAALLADRRLLQKRQSSVSERLSEIAKALERLGH